jgi:GH18 family chitinase
VITGTKVVNCWLRQSERRLDNKLIDVQNSNMDGDGSDRYNNDNLEDEDTNVLEENMESVNGDDDTTVLNKLAGKIQTVWTKRSKALRTDISIAGWMRSPINEIQLYCYKFCNGEHQNATTRLYKQWFGHEVTLLFLFL